MYNKHFGFSESPFSVTPDPRFFYTNALYQEALAAVDYGIKGKKGFIAITGEVGTGKTTLLRKAMRNLEPTTRSVVIFNTHLNFIELLGLVLRELGLQPQDNRLAMIEEINRYLIEQFKQQHIVCLLIDEAQNLSDEALEGLRLLSNVETDKEKLLQIVLIGQPELEAKLDQPTLRQLKQRIALHCRIAPLKREEVGSYIDFRLRAAGYAGESPFAPAAVQRIALYSGGIPRLINSISDNALLISYAAAQKTVAPDMVEEAAEDLRLSPQSDIVDTDTPQPPTTNARRKYSAEAPPNRVKGSAWVGAGSLLAVFLVASGTTISVLNFKTFNEYFFEGSETKPRTELFLRPPETIEQPKVTIERPLPDEETQRIAIRLETPVNKGLYRLRPPIGLDSESFQPRQEKIEKEQRESSLGNYRVVRASFVRNMPRSDAEIIATLEPRREIRVISKIGSYFKVQSLGNGAIQGYVHREDAFFVLSTNSR